ncbi:conjugative transfer system coupling protein TraD [Diaphorobacter sp. LR2014-1]|uniref:conjugative transfer system coupling protein TraD n=1 Tax=Diaphorobacter sp. LR2014-1 TaxID=1933219 RepID=UPI000CDA025E|nr:conjugative transfer system coupling protein TraD [Diaphorobacter sp. LR2014-1]POR10844.1 hypothetical protein BV908_08945 [Diaphorobacter sp. LR2014-1]
MSIEYRTYLRPIYEAKAAAAWIISSFWCLAIGAIFNIGYTAGVSLVVLCLGMGLWRGYKGRELVERKLALVGSSVEILPVRNLLASMPAIGNNLWLGRGWRWEPRHTAIAYELSKHDTEKIYPEPWVTKLLGMKHKPADMRGLQWVHGLEPKANEKDVLSPMDALKGHCAIIATTGAIKTRLAALILTQLIAKGDTVIVIDPKGDAELREICRLACEHIGQPEKFMMLHPAFASESIRLDLLKNWDRVSQVASRISLVLGSTNDDSFTGFCWNAVHRITSAMKYIGMRVNLVTLKNSMESRSATERIAYKVLKKFFTEEAPQLIDRVEQAMNSGGAAGGRPKKGDIETSIPELTAMIKVYYAEVPETKAEAVKAGLPMKSDDINGLLSIVMTSQEWFGKMITSILPMLTKLTTDDLKGLLSPDYEDAEDKRPIMDMKRIISGGHVLYIGTDALADPSVGKALAAMTIADMASVAAEIFNYGMEGEDGGERRRVHLLVDEWGDVMCEPLVQQANKGRGANIFIWALGQTFSDLVVAFGNDQASAKRFMGNMNNLIVGAIQDLETAEMIAEKFGKTSISVMAENKGTGSKTEDTGLEYSASGTRSISDKEVPKVSVEILQGLPDLQYLALVNRTMAYKGRIPVVTMG